MQGATALAVGAVLLVGAGCGGGGGGGGATTAVSGGVTITAPTISTAPSSGARNGQSTGTVPSSITLPGGQTVKASQLTPFRNCVQRHGGTPLPLDNSQYQHGSRPHGMFGPGMRREVRARMACIDELPATVRERYQQLRARIRRFHQQRQSR